MRYKSVTYLVESEITRFKIILKLQIIIKKIPNN
jgi:hypothetical protein